MKLTWESGSGPATTQELAALILSEKRLGQGHFIDNVGLRCLWGMIADFRLELSQRSFTKRYRGLSLDSMCDLKAAGLSISANDAFQGTPEGRCQEMARRCAAIP